MQLIVSTAGRKLTHALLPPVHQSVVSSSSSSSCPLPGLLFFFCLSFHSPAVPFATTVIVTLGSAVLSDRYLSLATLFATASTFYIPPLLLPLFLSTLQNISIIIILILIRRLSRLYPSWLAMRARNRPC